MFNNYLSTLIVYLRSFDQVYTDDSYKHNNLEEFFLNLRALYNIRK